MKKQLITRTFLLFILLFSACKSTKKVIVKTDNNQNIPFHRFLNEFKNTKLPLKIKGCKLNTDSNILNQSYKDTVFIKEGDTLYIRNGIVPYCTFKTNGNYIAVISLAEADCFIPLLTTYSLSGKFIDEKAIYIGGCGVGQGFNCEEFMTLRKNYSLYTSDTISIFKIDSLGNEIKGTTTSYVTYKTGRLLSSGKIELSGETKKIINK